MEIYSIPIRLGIDDINYYPTAQESEWWTEEQWKKFYEEIPARKERDRLYVEQLRMEGRYGKQVELKVSVQYNPAFDEPPVQKGPLSSHKVIFLDLQDKPGDPKFVVGNIFLIRTISNRFQLYSGVGFRPPSIEVYEIKLEAYKGNGMWEVSNVRNPLEPRKIVSEASIKRLLGPPGIDREL